MAYDKVTGDLAGGVLMLDRSFEDMTVYNLFETEEYAAYCDMMYRWAQKGYISPDAAVTTEAPEVLLATNNYFGEFYWAQPKELEELSINVGHDMTTINIVPGYVANGGGQPIMWNIPITSENPEKAMETLNYIYKNKEAAWLLQFGLEGQSYEVVEENSETKLIKYLDDTSKLPYYQVYGVFGDRLQWPALSPLKIDHYERLKANDDAIPETRYSPALGYSFVQESVSTEIAAVKTVIEQYTPSFNSGALDPAKALPEFRSALKDAGIDKVITENQRQLDEWAANNK